MGKKEQKEAKPAEGKWLVQYDKKGCIGAATCEAVYPERWEVGGAGKAELKGSTSSGGFIFELHIGADEFDRMKAAAEGCPKNVIHIINKDTGEKAI